jgi:hypothetical protein
MLRCNMACLEDHPSPIISARSRAATRIDANAWAFAGAAAQYSTTECPSKHHQHFCARLFSPVLFTTGKLCAPGPGGN